MNYANSTWRDRVSKAIQNLIVTDRCDSVCIETHRPFKIFAVEPRTTVQIFVGDRMTQNISDQKLFSVENAMRYFISTTTILRQRARMVYILLYLLGRFHAFLRMRLTFYAILETKILLQELFWELLSYK